VGRRAATGPTADKGKAASKWGGSGGHRGAPPPALRRCETPPPQHGRGIIGFRAGRTKGSGPPIARAETGIPAIRLASPRRRRRVGAENEAYRPPRRPSRLAIRSA